MDKEAQTFNIKKDHTITRLMIDALVEYKQEKQRTALDNRLKDKLGDKVIVKCIDASKIEGTIDFELKGVVEDEKEN